MNKNFIKFLIILVVAALVYSAFWFFKVGQTEKKVRSFISENSAYVSAGEITVSGFPLSQRITIKDLKFTIPSPLVDKRQVMVKQLEARAGIFTSEFFVTMPEAPTVQDQDGNIAHVEFSKEPEIKIAITDGRISKFSYEDFGYRILDNEKNVIYAASSSLVNLESATDSAEKITTKITMNIKDIEGFDVVDVYKNAFEKKIMDGIKTGEVVLGNASTALIATAQAAPAASPAVNSAAQKSMVKNDAVKNAVANAQAAVASAASAGANAAKNPAAVPAIPAATKVQAQVAQTQSQGQSQGQSQVQAQMPAAATAPASGQVAVNNAAAPAGESKPENLAPVANSGLVKSNLVLDLEYVLTPNQPAEQQAKLPANPAEIQEIPLQYSKLVKVNNLEFSNPLYKIIINGEMNSLQDDSMPSGSLSVKVEKVDTLISYLSTGLSQIADQKKPMAATQVQSSNLAGNGMIMEDSYQSFLRRIVAGLSPVAKELAAKNAVSKEDIAQFDIRREKNLEFLINETPMREILGKF